MSLRQLAPLLLGLLSSGCVGQDLLPIELHLCPASGLSEAERQALTGLSWTIEVWGLEDEDATWRETLGGGQDLTVLTLAEAIPQEEMVRLFVQGRGGGDNQLLALAVSAPLQFRGGERPCLCVAPADRYVELCSSWSCRFDESSQTCADVR